MRLLSKETLEKINKKPIREAIAELLGKSENQVRRYIASNDPILTTISALCLLELELKTPAYELLEPGPLLTIQQAAN